VAIITTVDALDEMVKDYLMSEDFAFDIETMGDDRDNPLVTHVIWLSLANDLRSDVIPMGHPNGALISTRKKPNKKGRDRMDRGIAYEDLNPKYDLSVEDEFEFAPPPDQLDRGVVMDALRPLFESETILKIGHNVKFDIHGMSKYFPYGVQGPFFDTLIASWLFDSRRVKGKMIGIGGLSLADCVKREFGDTLVKGVGKMIERHSFMEVAKYALLDAEATHDLYVSLTKKFTPQIKRLMDLEMGVLEPVLEMERSGVHIDTGVLREVDEEVTVEVADLEERMYRLAHRRFNPRSNKDKQEILFLPKSEGGQGIRSSKLTPAGVEKAAKGLDTTIYDKSVDNEVLEANSSNPMVSLLLDHGRRVKLHGTYVVPYLGGVPIGSIKYKPSQLRNGRIYGQFKQSGTESGRFSSSNPNLQNIPSRTREGRIIRSAFTAYPGEVMIAADYSQIEPRIIASLAEDPTMIDAYLSGGDVYQTVADRMGVTRQVGKTLVLAIAYGVGPTKISGDIGCTMAEARSLMDFFRRSFPKIEAHKKGVIRDSKRRGYSETIFSRRRVLDFKSTREDVRAMAERQAYNHLIQGSAADIMKIALINVYAALPDAATMLMTVHDEVVLSCPPDLVEEVKSIVVEEMEGSRPNRIIKVPLVAEVKSGHSWADCK